MNAKGLKDWASSQDLSLSESQFASFSAFEACLYEANEVMNLTRVPKEECWLRHFVDSLLFQDLIPQGAEVLDIGTGPGFPAWPLAVARPDLRVTALDSSGKMLGFLARFPLPNLTIAMVRAEEWGAREVFDFVTGRAVAPLTIQLELSAAPCKLGGFVVPMRTPADNLQVATVATLGLRLEEVHRRILPQSEIERVFPVYLKVGKTPSRFPRKWSEIRSKPLG
ncbi:MAG TPA: 16S rRNA (guanine(527)-N(7))-methyltransferase RsmG [Fimbriimonas sp.]|nr:16S rRNA (guanine(527)-N(7))-methyltransferase RsmG [Fimbriimonas sp.]